MSPADKSAHVHKLPSLFMFFSAQSALFPFKAVFHLSEEEVCESMGEIEPRFIVTDKEMGHCCANNIP